MRITVIKSLALELTRWKSAGLDPAVPLAKARTTAIEAKSAIRLLQGSWLPLGEGIARRDVDLDNSTPEKIEINVVFRAMNDYGEPGDFVDYRVIITPSLVSDFKTYVSGPSREVRDHLESVFRSAMSEKIFHYVP